MQRRETTVTWIIVLAVLIGIAATGWLLYRRPARHRPRSGRTPLDSFNPDHARSRAEADDLGHSFRSGVRKHPRS